MSSYNFDEIQGEQPTFIMGGHTFRLRYPTVGDIEEIGDLKTEKERVAKIYSFVETTQAGQPSFEEVIRTKDIRVLQAFTKMVQKEFGIEEK